MRARVMGDTSRTGRLGVWKESARVLAGASLRGRGRTPSAALTPFAVATLARPGPPVKECQAIFMIESNAPREVPGACERDSPADWSGYRYDSTLEQAGE